MNDLEINENEQLQYIFRYIISNSTIPITLIGFCFTSIVFLFSFHNNFAFTEDFEIIFVFITLSIGLLCLFESAISYHVLKRKLIKFILLEQNKRSKLKIKNVLNDFIKLESIYNFIFYFGFINFQVSVLILILNLVPIIIFAIVWFILIPIFIILDILITIHLKELRKIKNLSKK